MISDDNPKIKEFKLRLSEELLDEFYAICPPRERSGVVRMLIEEWLIWEKKKLEKKK